MSYNKYDKNEIAGGIMTLLELRKSKKLTQSEAAKICGTSLRTYIRYEKEDYRNDTSNYKSIVEALTNYNLLDEEHGVLTLDEIKDISKDIFKEYDVEFCYLFGSYARNEAGPKSDIDIFVYMKQYGMKIFGLIEDLRENLHKKIDFLDHHQIDNNGELAFEILKDGIKIYDKHER